MKRRQAKRERAGLAAVAAALRKAQAATYVARQQGTDNRRLANDLKAQILRGRYLSDELAKAASHARDVARLVGEESIARRVPVYLALPQPDGWSDFRVPTVERMPAWGARLDIDTAPVAFLHMETMRLLRVDVVRDGIANMRHVRVRLKGHNYGYAIGDRAIAGMPADMLAKNIGEEIARELVAALKI